MCDATGLSDDETSDTHDILKRMKTGDAKWSEFVRYCAAEKGMTYKEAMMNEGVKKQWKDSKPKKVGDAKKKKVARKCPKCGHSI